MSLAAEFDSRADRRAYALVAAGAAGLSYWHARAFFEPFMGPVGASVTPLMMDAVVYWLAAANVRQALAGRPLPMLRAGAYALLALTVTANALGGATVAERVFLALPAALFGFLVEARTRLALYHHRAEHGDDRLRLRLWLRHPVKAARAWLWLARQSAPAFDRATAERDRLHAARDAVTLALPGRTRAARRARAGVLRELNAGRLPAATAVAASGLLTRPGVPELHRVALVASMGGALEATAAGPGRDDTGPAAEPRTELGSEPPALPGPRTEPDAPEPDAAPPADPDPAPRTEPDPAPVVPSAAERRAATNRAALVAELADVIVSATEDGASWQVNYAALEARTGYRRSWAEKVVRDARAEAARRMAPDTRTDQARTAAGAVS